MEKITLSELLKYDTEENIKNKFLNNFKSLENNDIEKFLHNRAIEFEKKSVSTTHNVFLLLDFISFIVYNVNIKGEWYYVSNFS